MFLLNLHKHYFFKKFKIQNKEIKIGRKKNKGLNL